VLHGVSRLPGGGCVDIALAVDGELLRVRIGNPALPPADGGGARHAQRSIGHRLAYAFGPRARMTTQWQDGYYRCELTVPIAGKTAAR
jgi:two-component system sensor histidine kinase AlgZ